MATYFIGEVMPWPGSEMPYGWLACDGSTQSNEGDYAYLAELLGDTFGRSSDTTFVLPDLRGRTVVHAGTAASGTSYTLGMTGGESEVVLSVAELPSHTHTLYAADVAGDTDVPAQGVALSGLGPVMLNDNAVAWGSPGGTQITLADASVGSAGSDQAHANIQPSIALRYMICWNGIYPAA